MTTRSNGVVDEKSTTRSNYFRIKYPPMKTAPPTTHTGNLPENRTNFVGNRENNNNNNNNNDNDNDDDDDNNEDGKKENEKKRTKKTGKKNKKS